MKKIIDISWNVTEDEYRADKAISYSMLSTFARKGPMSILTMDEKKKSKSMDYGSLVDCLITDPDSLSEKFSIVTTPQIPKVQLKIVNKLFNIYGETYHNLDSIPAYNILEIINSEGVYKSYKDDTKLKIIYERCKDHYDVLRRSNGKTIISVKDYSRAKSNVAALKTNPFTRDIFSNEDLESGIEKVYQIKFRTVVPNILASVRCMLDLLVVDHNKKTIKPYDLKTTSKNEIDFGASILEWRYDIQATMYSWILNQIISDDSYFKDFTILPFTFIVINKYNEAPLLWEFSDNLESLDRVDRSGNTYKGWLTLLCDYTFNVRCDTYKYDRTAYKNNGLIKFNDLAIKI